MVSSPATWTPRSSGTTCGQQIHRTRGPGAARPAPCPLATSRESRLCGAHSQPLATARLGVPFSVQIHCLCLTPAFRNVLLRASKADRTRPCPLRKVPSPHGLSVSCSLRVGTRGPSRPFLASGNNPNLTERSFHDGGSLGLRDYVFVPLQVAP